MEEIKAGERRPEHADSGDQRSDEPQLGDTSHGSTLAVDRATSGQRSPTSSPLRRQRFRARPVRTRDRDADREQATLVAPSAKQRIGTTQGNRNRDHECPRPVAPTFALRVEVRRAAVGHLPTVAAPTPTGRVLRRMTGNPRPPTAFVHGGNAIVRQEMARKLLERGDFKRWTANHRGEDAELETILVALRIAATAPTSDSASGSGSEPWESR